MNITIARGTEQFGPYTLEEIQSYLASGHLTYSDLHWTDGMPDWRPLSERFSAPQAAMPPAYGAMTSGISYAKDPAALTRFVVIMLWVSLGIEVITLLGDFAQMSLLNRPYTHEEALANDSRPVSYTHLTLPTKRIV